MITPEELMERVKNIPPSGEGWWHSSGAETFTDLGMQLVEAGFTADAAIELLESAYSAVANEFGA